MSITIIYSQTKDEILNQQSEFDGYKLNFAQTALRVAFHFWFCFFFLLSVPFGKCVTFFFYYFIFKWNVCSKIKCINLACVSTTLSLVTDTDFITMSIHSGSYKTFFFGKLYLLMIDLCVTDLEVKK